MKKIFFYLIVFLIPFIVQSEKIKIKDIRVSGNTKTKDYVILNMISVKVGDIIDEKELKGTLKNIKRLLMNTNYFYDAYAFRLYSQDKSETVIQIEVNEGFLWRFGGGPSYFMIGKDNIGGDALSALMIMGINRQDNFIRKRFFFSSKYGLGVRTSHRIYFINDEKVDEVDFLVENFYEYNTFLNVFFNLGYFTATYNESEFEDFFLDVLLKGNNFDDVFYPTGGCSISLLTKFTSDYNVYLGSFDCFFKLPFKFIGSVNLQDGLIKSDAPLFKQFNINTYDRLKNTNFDDNLGENFWCGSISLNRRLFETTIPYLYFRSFFDIGLFYEIGRLEGWEQRSSDFGIRMGLHFPNPVFVHINLFGVRNGRGTEILMTINSEI